MNLLGEVTRHDQTISVAGRVLARDELMSRAAAVAGEIWGASSVAVHATASLETVVAVVGGLLAGVPIVPLPPDSGPDERAHILGDSGASLLLAARGAYASMGDEPPVVPIDGLVPGSSRPAKSSGTRTALILYTSGTTGPPKGVQVSHEAIAAGLDALADAWEWTPDDTLVHGLPLFHVHGLVLGVLGALRVGSPLIHTGRPKPDAYAAARGSLYFGVPTVWSRVCAYPEAARALSKARLLVSGSAPLPVPVFEQLTQLTGHRPVERYGMTETLITISARADGDRRPGHVGLPLAGVETKLAAEDGTPVPHDGETPGELHLRAPMVFDGYLNRPEATQASFTEDGWFRTGDIAAIGPDGWHRIVGRASTDLIKSGGYRIGAGEVENALLAHPAVQEAAVIGTPHSDLGEQVTAFVVADGVDEKTLIGFVAERLSAHKRPRIVHLVGELPRNAMGKVVKTRLTS